MHSPRLSAIALRAARFQAARRRAQVLAVCAGFAMLAAGCTIPRQDPRAFDRSFRFETDTLAYANGLVWEYFHDATGRWTHRRREPPPDFSNHCFAVARFARQFFQRARFDPTQPKADEAAYRRLVRQVVRSAPAREVPPERRIAIPGYANLREFSDAWAGLLKAESGGAWRSYVQTGHWRMILPFSRRHQQATVHQLLASLARHRPPVVHVTDFPSLKINHALLIYDATEEGLAVRFAVYDPNNPERPTELTYDRRTRTFHFGRSNYFPGGPVNLYEVYTGWCY
jgi:hypothetical protein